MNAYAPATAATPYREPPHNVEMEQALLGSLLLNNQVMEIVAPIIGAEDFFEEIHRRIFEIASSLISSGQAATPFTLKTFLGDHDLGGGMNIPLYLARLRSENSLPLMARDYAVGIRDLAVRRKIIAAAEEVSNQAYDLPVTVTPSQMAGEAIATLHAIAGQDKARNTRVEAHAGAADMIAHIKRVSAGEARPKRVSTGFADLDAATEGYQPGTLWVVAARPGQGKTVFFATSANKAAKRGAGVQGFSLEVAKEQMMARLLADLAFSSRQPMSFQHIMRGELAPDEIWRLEEAHDRLRGMPLALDVASRLTPAEIRIRTRAERDRMASKGFELKVVFIDYLKQIQASERYKGNRVYEVGEISYSLKQLAKDEGICVVLLAQLNRGLESREDKRPGLADLRESGDLEADADVVAFIHRESFYIERSPAYRAHDKEATAMFLDHKNKAEIILGKNRAGPTKTVDVWCDVSCSTMSDHVREG